MSLLIVKLLFGGSRVRWLQLFSGPRGQHLQQRICLSQPIMQLGLRQLHGQRRWVHAEADGRHHLLSLLPQPLYLPRPPVAPCHRLHVWAVTFQLAPLATASALVVVVVGEQGGRFVGAFRSLVVDAGPVGELIVHWQVFWDYPLVLTWGRAGVRFDVHEDVCVALAGRQWHHVIVLRLDSAVTDLWRVAGINVIIHRISCRSCINWWISTCGFGLIVQIMLS